MGKDYRDSHNQDKRFRGKKPDRFKKNPFQKKSGGNRFSGDGEVDTSFLDELDSPRGRQFNGRN